MTTWNRDDSDLSTLTGISSTTVGSVRITGNTIGLTSDTDLLSLADGALTVNGSITGTLLTSAQTSITSLGTLTSLTVDNIILNGTTIGHTDDTDLISIASGALTVNGNLTVTGTLDASDTNITNVGSIALDTITNDGSDITLDSSGDIILDADSGGDIHLKDGGTTFGQFDNSGGNLRIKNGSGLDTVVKFSGENTELEGDLDVGGHVILGTNKKVYLGTEADNDYIVSTGDSLGFYTNNTQRYEVTDSYLTHYVPSVYSDAGAILKDGSNHTRLSFTDSGNTILADESGNTTLTLDTSQNVTIAGDLTITGGNITNAITFDSGITNAGTIAAGTWSGTALVAGKVPAHDDLTGFVANEHLDWTGASAGTIHATNYTNTTYTGGTNLTLDGTTFNVDDAFLVNNASDTMTGTLTIDKNSGASSTSTAAGLNVDFDHLMTTASGQTIQNFGIDLAVNSNSVSHVGTVFNTGLRMQLSAGTSGTQTQYGIYSDVSGGDTNIGYYGNTGNSDLDFKIIGDDASSYFTLATGANGATTLQTVDDGGTTADLTLRADGATIVSILDGSETDAFHVSVMGATNRMFSVSGSADSNSDLIMYEMGGSSTDDFFKIIVGEHGDTTLQTVDAAASAANLTLTVDGYMKLNPSTATFTTKPIGFTQNEPTFNATDTIITFSTTGNKQKLTLTNNCTDIHFKFPAYSGNFVCVLLQDGSGSRTISNWKTQDSAGNAGAGNSGLVLWAGGTAPNNTETANKADIVSFYWDADNEIAYGTYTYNF